jgi:hypothetical protein
MRAEDYMRAAPRTESVFTWSTYTGTLPAPVRRGATDAASIPSLINGQRVAPHELRAQLVAPLDTYTPPVSMPAPIGTRQAPKPAKNRRAPSAGIPAEHRTVRPLPPRRVPAEVYVPRGMPSLLLAYLKEHGGHLSYADIRRRYGIGDGSVDACLRRPIAAGLLIHVRLGKRISAAALPGYVPSEAAIEDEYTRRRERFRATKAARAASR